MLLGCIFFFIAFSFGLAQKNCGRERVVYPAPVFGAGDNLSADKCGVWDPQINRYGPWYVRIWMSGNRCGATLISPTSVLTYHCEWAAKQFAESENKDDWKAWLGKCAQGSDEVKCVERGEGQILEVKNVTELNAPGTLYPLHIWKIEKVTLKENYIAPICFSNKGNLRDFDKTQQYAAFWHDWDNSKKVSAELSEDFGPCRSKSKNFTTCDKVRENFLCARISTYYYWNRFYLSHEENNRHFLRAFLVELIRERDLFYYDLVPLLEQISSASGDISLMAQIPLTKKKTDFVGGQSFPNCGTLSPTNRIKRDSSTEKALGFIYHGDEAKPNDQPWHAALIRDDDIKCGATLVSTTALVTAAHCVVLDDGNTIHRFNVEVTIGLHNLNHFDNLTLSRQQTKTPSQIIPHENYTYHNFDNDIAVILVSPGFEVTATVRPICLWNQDYDLEHIVDAFGKVVGYGFIANSTRPDILQTVNLKVQSYKNCYLTQINFFKNYLKPGHNFCAGGHGATACAGDSGGGFTLKIDGKWFLRGVVSSGNAKRIVVEGKNVTKCYGNLPSLYTDVTFYMDWVAQKANLQTITN